MTPKQFYALDEMEQAQAVWDGKVIAIRKANNTASCYTRLKTVCRSILLQAYNELRKFEAYTEHELLDIYLPKN